jgi:hypothetical protein
MALASRARGQTTASVAPPTVLAAKANAKPVRRFIEKSLLARIARDNTPL